MLRLSSRGSIGGRRGHLVPLESEWELCAGAALSAGARRDAGGAAFKQRQVDEGELPQGARPLLHGAEPSTAARGGDAARAAARNQR